MDAINLGSQWSIEGVIQERRPLTSAKSPDWRGWLIKVATLGNAFEIMVGKDQYDMVHEGEVRKFAGELEYSGNKLRLICKTISGDKRRPSTPVAAA